MTSQHLKTFLSNASYYLGQWPRQRPSLFCLRLRWCKKFNQHTKIHTLEKMMVLHYHLQLRGKGQWDFIMATDFFWTFGNVISRLRQELRQDLHGHETPTFQAALPLFAWATHSYPEVTVSVKALPQSVEKIEGAAFSGLFQHAGVPFKEMTTLWHHAWGRKRLIVVVRFVLPHIPCLQRWALSSKWGPAAANQIKTG